MRLNNRLKKLEERMGVTGPCRCCGGAGVGRVVMVVNGVEQQPLARPGCPACGQEQIWKQYDFDLPEQGRDEARRVLCHLGRCAVTGAAA